MADDETSAIFIRNQESDNFRFFLRNRCLIDKTDTISFHCGVYFTEC